MSKRQTRKTVSMPIELYATLDDFCRKKLDGISMSKVVQQLILDMLYEHSIDVMPRADAVAAWKAKHEAKQVGATKAASGIFTF